MVVFVSPLCIQLSSAFRMSLSVTTVFAYQTVSFVMVSIAVVTTVMNKIAVSYAHS